ncbi:hypothetical protein IKE79_01745 [Candidatus Saccharibacteria bacterium]|nr:hypothetical protein [Candidatus Saccharibacteria bacterium]
MVKHKIALVAATLAIPVVAGVFAPAGVWAESLPGSGLVMTVANDEATVATLDGVAYTGLDAVFEAIANDAGSGVQHTVVLQKDTTAGGYSLKSGVNFVLDFNGHTLTMATHLVGSTGTQSQNWQLLKDSTIEFKNGKLVASGNASMLIQNYSNLTLRDLEIDATTMVNNGNYVISNNNGLSQIIGNTSIKTGSKNYAFDACWGPKVGYPNGAQVVVDTTGTIEGIVQVDLWGAMASPVLTTLDIKNGTFIGALDVDARLAGGVTIEGGVYSVLPALDYIKQGYTAYADSGSYVVTAMPDTDVPNTIYLAKGASYDLTKVMDATARKYGNFNFSGIQKYASLSNWVLTGTAAGSGQFEYRFEDAYGGGIGNFVTVVVYEVTPDEDASEGDADVIKSDAAAAVEAILNGADAVEGFEYADGIDAQDVKNIVAEGGVITTTVSAGVVASNEVSEEVAGAIDDEVAESLGEDATLAGYYDIDVELLAVVNGDEIALGRLTKLSEEVMITVDLPEGLEGPAAGMERTYFMVRYHNGETKVINAINNGDGTISISSGDFSTYALAYVDEPVATTPDTGMITGASSVTGDYRGLVATVVAMTVMTVVMEIAMWKKNQNKR